MIDKRRILVVDDEKLVLAMLKDVLQAKGYEVLEALDGEEGLAKARAERPDLIILDVMMPKLDGFKVARLLKYDRNYQHIPIIMLTAKAGEKDLQASRVTKVDLYLVKPVDPKLLLEKVAGLLQGQAK